MKKSPPIYGVTQPSTQFGPAHPAFWAGQWRDRPYAPTFENFDELTAEVEESELEDQPMFFPEDSGPEGYHPAGSSEYAYKQPYWTSNYFYTPRRWGRWNYRSPFMWSSYYRPWDYPL